MEAPEETINISPLRDESPSKHVRLSSASSDMSYSSDISTIPSLSTYSDSTSTILSPFVSPPTTPRSPLPGSRLHRFTSHEQLSSFVNTPSSGQQKRDWASTSSLLSQDYDDDKFTQLPMPSPRERRSSSLTYSSHCAARSRRSLANLRKPLLLNNNSSDSTTGIDEETSSSTPKGVANSEVFPIEGNKLSRKHIEASRRSAREALEEDYRALEPGVSKGDEFVCKLSSITPRQCLLILWFTKPTVDCYFTSLDYLIKALKMEDSNTSDSKHRKAIRVRLQTLLESFSTPEELAEEQAKRYQDIAKALQAAPSITPASQRCQCAVTTIIDYLALIFNIVASAVLSVLVYIVDALASTPRQRVKTKAT